jgi:23S rRNA (uridine2552-2'-O)-methyltransferase
MTRQNPYKRPDRFTQEAKKAGYPARSVFKLMDIDRRVRLFAPGMHVLDLGAAPGSWARYIADKIGRKGELVAVDLKPLETALPANSTFVLGDALALDPKGAIAEHAPYNVVVSDMAPSTTGNRDGDQARSYELFMRALEVASILLAPGGAFVGKIFMGEDFPHAREAVRRQFAKHRMIRPEGTRANSYEIFIVAEGKK